jgi:hypothetical protein
MPSLAVWLLPEPADTCYKRIPNHPEILILSATRKNIACEDQIHLDSTELFLRS